MSATIILLLLVAIAYSYFMLDDVVLKRSQTIDDEMPIDDLNAFGILIRNKAVMFMLVLIIFNVLNNDVYARVVGEDNARETSTFRKANPMKKKNLC